MEYYSAIERNKIMQFVETWMDLETATQSQASQKEKDKYCILMHTGGIQKKGINDLRHRHREQTWIPRGKQGWWDEVGDWD